MNNIFSKIWLGAKAAYEKDWVKIGLTFLFLSFCYGVMYFSINRTVGLDDPLFNIRFAEIFRTEGFSAFNNFQWLPFTKISENHLYISYNFLFYSLLVLFTFITPLFLALKVYGVIFFALSFTILYFFLLKVKIKNPFFWIFILLAVLNYNGVVRFLTVRAFALAPALLILELYFLYKRKYWGVFFVSLFYFFWHNATFFLPLAISVLFAGFNSFYGKKVDLMLILSSAVAVIGAFVLTAFFIPGFLNIFHTIFLIFYETIIGKTVNVSEGSELYPANLFNFLRANIPTVGLFVVAVAFEIYQYVQAKSSNGRGLSNSFGDKQPLKGTLFFLSLLFFLGIFITQRSTDFFIFFFGAYIAMSFDEIINYIEIKKETVKKSIVSAIFALCLYLFIGNLLFTQSGLADVKPYNGIQGVAEWLKNNTAEKEIVFSTTWNWFPQLFYFNTWNYYIVGLEPRSFYEYNKEFYWAWWNISNQGFVCTEENCDNIKNRQFEYLPDDNKKKIWYEEEGNNIADYIKNNFKSRFVLTAKDYGMLNMVMDNNKRFKKVYTDKVFAEFYIYEIK